MSEFRNRAVEIEVDTTKPAEFQIQGFHLSDEFMDRVARSFKSMPLKPEDTSYGPFNMRSIDGFDFLYVIGRQDGIFVVTIGDVWRTEDRSVYERLLEKSEVVATLRGTLGV